MENEKIAKEIVDTWIVIDEHTKVIPIKKDRDEMMRRIIQALESKDAEILRLKETIEAYGDYDSLKRIAKLEAQVAKYRWVLKRIAKPALGGKEQQYIAKQALEDTPVNE